MKDCGGDVLFFFYRSFRTKGFSELGCNGIIDTNHDGLTWGGMDYWYFAFSGAWVMAGGPSVFSRHDTTGKG